MSESGHWYSKDGKACHTQPTKPGAKSKTRPTDIRDAKRLGLFPSVTGITGVLSSPQLQRWREKRIVETCYDVRPGQEEGLDEYAGFIMERAFESVKGAQDIGTAIHAILEDVYSGKDYDRQQPLTFPTSGKIVPACEVIYPIIEAVKALNIEPRECEARVVSLRHGYAGTTDLPFGTADKSRYGILDWKTKKTKPAESIYPSETYAMQIAAYMDAYWGGISDGCVGHNVFISTTELGRVEVVTYDAARLRKEWDAFKHCLALWEWRNGYSAAVKEAA